MMVFWQCFLRESDSFCGSFGVMSTRYCGTAQVLRRYCGAAVVMEMNRADGFERN